MKYGPDEINDGIAELLNEVARTGKYPKEIKEGILIPLPKPGKKKGPPGNLRPIILLSMLRKILAICMIRRTIERLNNRIPISQAAYREGRSTTELIFSMKVLAEKAITSSSYKIIVLLLDMSKAFDTVDRGQLFEDLKEVLEEDELHMISILLKDVRITVRIKNTSGEPFTSNVGVPQGDCLSPVLFTYYLAKAIKGERIETVEDHEYCKSEYNRREFEDIIPPQVEEHNYSRIPYPRPLTISQQYADDIGWLTTSQHMKTVIKEDIPPQLKHRNLHVNESKTEEYTIERNGDTEWMSCKYVGSHPDTETDFKRRKKLAMGAYQQNKRILESDKISLNIRIRLFNAYVTSIFMYNSELWGVPKKFEERIDIFQRRLLRKILKIRWPHIIPNEALYERTGEIKWSKKIKVRCLRWTGHLHRLPDDAPARQALREALIPAPRPPGRPKTTWISTVNKDLKDIDPNLRLGDAALDEIASDRPRWRSLIQREAQC